MVAHAPEPQYSTDVFEEYKEVLADWSRQGRTFGRHVKFPDDAKFKMPKLGTLGSGGFGEVIKTFCPYEYHGKVRKTYIARKKYFHSSSALDDEEVWREISIQKRLRHQHVLELVGSYELRGKIFALFWPVAPFTLCNVLDAVKNVGVALGESGEFSVRGDVILKDIPEGSVVRRSLDHLAAFVPAKPGVLPSSYSLETVVNETVRRLFAAFGCLAEALRYIAAQKVRHRDLKPGNIMMFPSVDNRHESGPNDPNAKDVPVMDGLRIGDFGLAKGHGAGNQSFSWTDTVAGTPLYNAPEELKNTPSGPQADVFSLGCIFLEILLALSVERAVRDPSCRFRARDNLKLSMHGYADCLEKFDEWVALLHESGEPQVQEHLISLISDMMSTEPTGRPAPTQVTTRLAMMEQLRNKRSGGNMVSPEETTHPLFGSCCKLVNFGREDYRLLRQIFPTTDSGPNFMSVSHLEPRSNGLSRPASPRGTEQITGAASGLQTPDSSPPRIRGPPQPGVTERSRVIRLNAKYQRIDPTPADFVPEVAHRVEKLRLCYKHYLIGDCEWGDACDFTHSHKATEKELRALSRKIRSAKVCAYGLQCDDPTCAFGHNCPNAKDTSKPELLTTKTNCDYGGPAPKGKCKYPHSMHDLDVKVKYLARPWTLEV